MLSSSVKWPPSQAGSMCLNCAKLSEAAKPLNYDEMCVSHEERREEAKKIIIIIYDE